MSTAKLSEDVSDMDMDDIECSEIPPVTEEMFAAGRMVTPVERSLRALGIDRKLLAIMAKDNPESVVARINDILRQHLDAPTAVTNPARK